MIIWWSETFRQTEILNSQNRSQPNNLLIFSKHVEDISARLKSRNKILKAITGSTGGKDKETLLDTYKAIGRPLINYAAPVWAPIISDTQMTKLRIVTGCHTMTAESHLHGECKILTVCTILTRQHLIIEQDRTSIHQSLNRHDTREHHGDKRSTILDGIHL